nr:hypothetical protein [Tanacetum cinerariifolium]
MWRRPSGNVLRTLRLASRISILSFGMIPGTLPEPLKIGKTGQRARSYLDRDPGRLLAFKMRWQTSTTQEYPSLIDTFFVAHTVNGEFLRDEERRIYEEMRRLEAVGTYTDDEINRLARGGKQRGHIAGVGRVLPARATASPSGANGSGGCGDEEEGADHQDDENEDGDGDTYKGYIIPKLSFPTIVPKQVNLTLWLNSPVDHLFFLKMREALSLASNFDIEISYWSSDIVVPLNIDIDNLRRKVPNPATNVRQLLVEIDFEEHMGAYLQFIDTFFSICHPNYLRVYRDKPSKDINSYKQMVKWMIEMKMPEVIDVKIKDPNTGKWEDQTNVWRSSPENLVAWNGRRSKKQPADTRTRVG